MIPDVKLKISLQELSLRGARIIAQQSEISFAAALQQVQRLKQTSKVKQSYSTKKKEYLYDVRSIDEYIDQKKNRL